MHVISQDSARSPRLELDRLIATFGFRRIALALLARMVRAPRKRSAAGLPVIPTYLRKDLGLPPVSLPHPRLDPRYMDPNRLW